MLICDKYQSNSIKMEKLVRFFNYLTILSIIIVNNNCLVMCSYSSSSSHRDNKMESTTLVSVMDLPAVTRAKEFKCKDPQARAYHLRDLMKSQGLITSDEKPAQLPAYLVVYRCDGHSGCCFSSNTMCTMYQKYFEELEIQFLPDPFSNASAVRRKIRVEQHKSCKCNIANYRKREKLDKDLPFITFV